MNTILFLIQKEFIQIFRSRILKAMIFIVPFVQLILLVNASTFELKNSNIYFVDNDNSSSSQKLISKFQGSKFFTVKGKNSTIIEAKSKLFDNSSDIVVVIPNNFERNLIRKKSNQVQLLINGINGVAAGITNAYTMSVISDFNKNIISENINIIAPKPMKTINTTYSHWYNPELEYTPFMVAGILVLLVTMIGLYLTSMNTVKEKEIGTIEQINVTPIKRYQFIAGKLFPFWIIAMFELALGLTLGKLIYDIPIVGDLKIVFLFASIYLPAALGIGLFISTITQTQQQAMMFSMFLTFIFILMSGLFTPVESMPKWAQYFNIINPVAYFIQVMRMILLKGSGLIELKTQFISIAIYSFLILGLSVWRYRKTA